MKSAMAIRTYLQAPPNGTPVSAGELAAMFKEMSTEEKETMGREACKLLGEQYDAPTPTA